MAYIGGIYIHVPEESKSRSVDASSHAVEKGTEITDTVKRKSQSMSISGLIVDWDNNGTVKTAKEIVTLIEDMMLKGTVVTYNGGDSIKNVQITSFGTKTSSEVWGGYEFDMSLQERRFAQNAYKESDVKNGGQKQVDKGDNSEVYYTVKKGDCVAALVAEPKAPYKNLKREGAKSGYWGACNWVMDKNPKAFSRAKDFRTLKIGAKLLVGTR